MRRDKVGTSAKGYQRFNACSAGAAREPWRRGERSRFRTCSPVLTATYLSSNIFAPSRPDLSQVKAKLGDYDRVKLAKVMTERVITGDAIEHFITHARDRTAIAFAVDVPSSKALVERFIAAGVPAHHVDAETPYEEAPTPSKIWPPGGSEFCRTANFSPRGLIYQRSTQLSCYARCIQRHSSSR
jgi:hypothetical protein